MLILTLRTDGCISIGDSIKIYNGEDHQIRLAIDAPKDISVTRSEAKVKGPKPPKA